LLVVLLALSQSWLSYASIFSSSHNPASWTGLDSAKSEAKSDVDVHDNRHDDAGTNNQSAGHQPEHNASDHSHDNPDLQRSVVHVSVKSTDDWVTPRTPAYPVPYFAFERPPKYPSMY
jgi:hypothetical protein